MRGRSRHRAAPVPWATPAPVVLDESYEREVQQSTARLEQAYARAQRRVVRAESRLRRVQNDARTRAKASTIAQLEAVLLARREELEGYRRMMIGTPASSVHRGTDSFRPVPVGRQISGP